MWSEWLVRTLRPRRERAALVGGGVSGCEATARAAQSGLASTPDASTEASPNGAAPAIACAIAAAAADERA